MRRKKQMSGIIVREALRLLKSGLSDRKVAEAVDISRSTCRRWRIRADYLELTEEKLETMTDEVLHTYFMGRAETKRGYQEVDKDQVKELREKRLQHAENLSAVPAGSRGVRTASAEAISLLQQDQVSVSRQRRSKG
jgi:hypothetical protein